MLSNEWQSLIENNWDALKSIILRYHPTKISHSDLRITAPRVEKVCENIRQDIRNKNSVITEDTLEKIKEKALEKPPKLNNLINILDETWYGVPESTDCWKIPGFSILCSLLEDLPE